MSKILLFFPKLEDWKPYHYMPISALAVASTLVAQGHKVKIHDQRVDLTDTLDTDIVNADEIMISMYTGFQLSNGYEFAKYVKEIYPGKRIVVGGPHATALPEQTLASPYVDEIFVGEMDTGEHPLPYHLIDVEKYINPATKRFIYVSSQGCPGVCTFCATKQKRPYKLLPMERVRTDIDNLMTRYSFKECVFFDATLFSMSLRVLCISELMKKHKLSWIADARAPEIAKEPNLAVLMERGLKQITIGLESGSPRVVELMRKGKKHLEHFKQAAAKMAQFPIKMVSGIVFGCPGETVQDLQQTIDYVKRIKEINTNFYISTTFFRPLPGTVMTDIAKEYGYKEPESLEEWARLGEQSHYSYNEYREAPWIPEPEKHKAVYERFRSEHKDLFI